MMQGRANARVYHREARIPWVCPSLTCIQGWIEEGNYHQANNEINWVRQVITSQVEDSCDKYEGLSGLNQLECEANPETWVDDDGQRHTPYYCVRKDTDGPPPDSVWQMDRPGQAGLFRGPADTGGENLCSSYALCARWRDGCESQPGEDPSACPEGCRVSECEYVFKYDDVLEYQGDGVPYDWEGTLRWATCKAREYSKTTDRSGVIGTRIQFALPFEEECANQEFNVNLSRGVSLCGGQTILDGYSHPAAKMAEGGDVETATAPSGLVTIQLFPEEYDPVDFQECDRAWDILNLAGSDSEISGLRIATDPACDYSVGLDITAVHAPVNQAGEYDPWQDGGDRNRIWGNIFEGNSIHVGFNPEDPTYFVRDNTIGGREPRHMNIMALSLKV